MFKSKTVFIVGAGASCEAGLPSGHALKDKITDLLDMEADGWQVTKADPYVLQAIQDMTRDSEGRIGDINPYLNKARVIKDVLHYAISIDNFLDAHKEDKIIETCGKLAVIRAILKAENVSQLRGKDEHSEMFYSRPLSHTWYPQFLQMLTENVRKEDIGNIFENVSFVTFNYDRCIERFLVQGLSEYYQIEIPVAEKLVRSLKIWHPYGKVGNLQWEGSEPSVPFGSQRVKLVSLLSQINTFAEGLADEQMLSQMHHAISEAETVAFLGFAFHPANMKLLTSGERSKATRTFATTLGISDASQEVIEKDIKAMLGRGMSEQSAYKTYFSKVTCAEFFQEYFRSLSSPVVRNPGFLDIL